MMPIALSLTLLVIAVLLTAWATFTLTRLDRLHARVDAAFAALDAQLVRRAAALLRGAESMSEGSRANSDFTREQVGNCVAVATEALQADPGSRELVENAVGRAIAGLAENSALVGESEANELGEATARLVIARRFYNDAVRDTRALRRRRMTRILRLAGHRELPQFFDIDDAVSFPTRRTAE
jgi:hypothetical protein